jgi:hypothetical protein
MANKVASITADLHPDDKSDWVTRLWDNYHTQRHPKVAEWKELRNYIFATDTSTTSNRTLPWKNSTTIPKLCQIRDNLHSNYISALFPNDNWIRWEAADFNSSLKDVADVIKGYMDNKTRMGHFQTEMSKLLYDYIDYGNAFATVTYEANYHQLDGEMIPEYIGPRVYRISPMDIVFNPLASSFEESFKIVRSVKTMGDIAKLAKVSDQGFWGKILEDRRDMRYKLGGYNIEDWDKYEGFQVDGFGNMYEYYMSDYVEILEFYGDWFDVTKQELHENVHIIVADRRCAVYEEPIPNWFGTSPFFHVGWRFRPDNLWSMGPLDNLVGMQYRIDHLENLKADAMDLAVHPMLVIQGEVEEFEWRPGGEIHIDESGGITELGKNLNGIISANNEISMLEQKMEEYAGAPREAMGIRSPGEKTAFEVQQLQNAGGRIFQEKITNFEIELLEPVLNSMLESARRNLDGADTIRVFDDELNVQLFESVTKDDITASGRLRPIGARHFAKQAQDLQNLMGVYSNPSLVQMLAPHTSAVQMTKFIEDVTGLGGYKIWSPNVAIGEQQETARQAGQAQEDLQVEGSQPVGGAA